MTRILITNNTTYEIQVQRFVWFMWRMVDHHRRLTKFSACRLAHGISKGKIKIIDKAK